MRKQYLAAVSAPALLVLAGVAGAQNTNITNPGFEDDDPTGATAPLGWFQFNNSMTIATGIAHTGQRSVKLSFENATANYAGVSTNYFDPENFNYPYDPTIIFLGGSITVSGWYMIPADHPIGGSAWASLKLQVRRTVNNSAYQEFDWPNSITGHTNGQWVFYTRTITNSDFQSWPLPPPTGGITRCTVLAQYFDPEPNGPPADTGWIYWDDLHLSQATGTACYANCDNSTNPPILNVNDFICFQSAFAAGDSYANCDNSTNPPVLNVNDFICFQTQFAAGCTAP